MGNVWSQLFPPAAKSTEKELPDQHVTGASSGVGKELAQILSSHNAKVYVAARSHDKANNAIDSIKSSFPLSKGSLVFLHLDLNDLTTIKKSADELLSKENRLDVLFNNAGVMIPPQGFKTEQGYELQLGTNNLGPFLLTELLTPLLVKTAKDAPAGSVRVVWVSSSAAESFSPKGSVELDKLDYRNDKTAWAKNSASKAGNVLHAKEYAKRHKADGIVSVSLNPGTLKTDLQRHMPGYQRVVLHLMLYTPIHGAYTELFAGVSTQVTLDKTGAWIIPWGRFGPLRNDLELASKTEAKGGTGIAQKFWEWTEKQVSQYR